MRICLFSNTFFPAVGGIGQSSDTLARAWVAAGHEVVLVTCVAAERDYDSQYPYPVIRLPRSGAWKQALAGADVVVCNGYSLRPLPLWLLKRERIVFVHQLFLGIDPENSLPFLTNLRRRARLAIRRALLPLAHHVFISHYIQRNVRGEGVVIYNPVGDEFRVKPEIAAGNAWAFFGRMVGEKGVATLLRAALECKERGRVLEFDLYGEGDTLQTFQKLGHDLGIASQLRWHGFLRGEALVDAMNRAKAVVVPSDWDEPMGIVAVEAMRCGKCVVGSKGGGLGEVLQGICPIFPNMDSHALAECLLEVDSNDEVRRRYEQKALHKSEEFKLSEIAGSYIKHFQGLILMNGSAKAHG